LAEYGENARRLFVEASDVAGSRRFEAASGEWWNAT
jgi:hypothetical protein